jgi:CP family cyanate transporter-like MFS transporter
VDYFKERNMLLFISILATFIGLFLMAFSFTTPWIPAVLIGIGIGGLFPLALMFPLIETNTAEDASAWTAMMQAGGYILGGTLPIISGIIRDVTNNNEYVFMLLMLLSLILLPLAYAIGKTSEKMEVVHT